MMENGILNRRGANKEELERIKENCKQGMEHFKKQTVKCEKLNEGCRAIIRKHEDKIDLLETYGKEISNLTPKDKTAWDKVCQDIEFNRAIIRHQKHKIVKNEELIKTSKKQAAVYWRHLDRALKKKKGGEKDG